MTKVKILDKISGICFTLAFFVSKLQYIPYNVFAPIFNMAALSLGLVGHSAWFVSSHYYHSHTQHHREWYGFSPFKEQHTFAATMGILASITSAVGIFFPIFLIPAAWLFFVANSFWSIGEYHKMKSPPKGDLDYSQSYQRSYLNYALSMTAMSFIAALAPTLIFLFPAISIPVLIVAGGLTLGFGILALEYWVEYNYAHHPKDNATKTTTQGSYQHMAQSLGATLQNMNTPVVQPRHEPALFEKANQHHIEDVLEKTSSLAY